MHKRGMIKSVARMVFTFGVSYLGAKAAGWIFDNVIDHRS